MYITKNGKCITMRQLNPDLPIVNIANQMISPLPKDAKLLKSGNSAESNLKVNLYGGVREKAGHKGILSSKSSATLYFCIVQGSSTSKQPLLLKQSLLTVKNRY